MKMRDLLVSLTLTFYYLFTKLSMLVAYDLSFINDCHSAPLLYQFFYCNVWYCIVSLFINFILYVKLYVPLYTLYKYAGTDLIFH